MFLSKIGEIYYLFFKDETGTRHKVSTKYRKKSEALSFLHQFKRNEFERRKKLKTISFFDFIEQFLEYSSGVHSPKTQRTNATAFKEFLRVEGNKTIALYRYSRD